MNFGPGGYPSGDLTPSQLPPPPASICKVNSTKGGETMTYNDPTENGREPQMPLTVARAQTSETEQTLRWLLAEARWWAQVQREAWTHAESQGIESYWFIIDKRLDTYGEDGQWRYIETPKIPAWLDDLDVPL